ncbi:hypothetical protein SADUNF_Sadunf03G0053300 [Salix dunnii]|uniref:Fe2OG dioxygenase domain-containing protein n=1 Tax=Salix dunnii TaxID=1413687 RepID=A0A835K949_9ROSI|nr:hypothetical protein SADUNF_Sadunf03G0053300 [Salix dunnii]
MAATAKLPIIDLSSPDRISTANSIRQACVDYGFFYLVNHGVEGQLLSKVLEESKKFFSLPLNEKMKLTRKHHRGYTPFYAEKLDPLSRSKGDSKESFYVGPVEGDMAQTNLNQWPSQEIFPTWRLTMETCHKNLMSAGKKLISLIALALNLDEDYFEKVGALDTPNGFLRLLHYPGMLVEFPLFWVCKEKFHQPRLWEDVLHIKGAFIVNIGDMMERWTNCFFRSTLHRVMPTGQERYSLAFFLDPNPDCVVECLESCCSSSCPARFPPIRSGAYLEERFKLSYGE